MTDPADRRVRIIVGIVALVLLAIALRWASDRPAPQRDRSIATVDASVSARPPREGVSRPSASVSGLLAAARDGGAVTVRDRAVRAQVREAIVRAWRVDGSAPTQGRDGVEAIPPRAASLDHRFIRDRIREDFLPMAQTCYESLLGRRAGVEGRVLIEFEIVADAQYGGLVEEARFVPDDASVPDAGVWEGEFLSCMRESMTTVAFLRPEGSGRVTVRYPFVLHPNDGGV